MSARQRIAALFDSFDEIAQPLESPDPIGFPGYEESLSRARADTGEDEAVVIGRATIDGREMVAAVFEFGFLGGSMGRVVGAKVEAATKAAAESGLPFVGVISSGGARMQEGMAALAQMPRTVAASAELANRGIPRIILLGHPTTGGVYASFASLGDILIAEDDATIGFAGPRVVEAMTGEPLPPTSHTARVALEAGLVDEVVPEGAAKARLATVLEILATGGPRVASTPESNANPAVTAGRAWREFELARHPDRPTPRQYASALFDPIFELRGDRAGTNDDAVFTAIARFDGSPAVIAAFDRARPKAGGFRKARRAIELAGRLRLPLVTFIDTPGADPSFDSEYAGLASAIAETFQTMLAVDVPTIAIVTGEGGSGGALALACADVVAIQEHAVFSVIAPEGAAEILYRDSSRAADVADSLRPTSFDLVKLGLADEVIAEPGAGAHTDPKVAARLIGDWLIAALRSALSTKGRRVDRFR
jgi:acetyl-CoA carboxylase carboxyl transferase beta subunit/acetyl-CoA carboxylase carboxyl transferase alpha subunit